VQLTAVWLRTHCQAPYHRAANIHRTLIGSALQQYDPLTHPALVKLAGVAGPGMAAAMGRLGSSHCPQMQVRRGYLLLWLLLLLLLLVFVVVVLPHGGVVAGDVCKHHCCWYLWQTEAGRCTAAEGTAHIRISTAICLM
jgi:hypothetical protein